MGKKSAEDLRVLVVDDAALLVRVLEEILESLGVRKVHVANSGEAAMELLRENEYDLVLSDVLMPGIGGVGLVRHIRETMGNVELPVYAITAESGSLDEFRAQGFTAVFVKPFTRENVAALLRKTLARLA